MRVVQSFVGHTNIQLHCDVAQDLNSFVSCSNGFNQTGCEVKVRFIGSSLITQIWDRRKGTLRADAFGHSATVSSCKFLTPSVVATCGQDGTVRLWDANTGAGQASAMSSQPQCMTKWEDNLVVGSFEGQMALWRWKPGSLTLTKRTKE